MNPPQARPDRPAEFSRPGRLALAAALLLLALHAVLAVGSKARESMTGDELAHLIGGFSYWQFDDYRLQPENGNLPQRWAALPAWLAGARFPPLAGNVSWRTSDAWILGHEFFYESGQDHFPWLSRGRAMIALFSVATGLLVFLWSRRLFGTPGGLVSLTLFAFCPSFLAHGALATSDVCMTFFFLAAVGAYWRHLHDGRRRSWLLSALVFGLACVAKYSAVLLLPMFVLMAVVRATAAEPVVLGGRTFSTGAGKLGAIALSTLGQGLVAAGVIWAFFGFRYAAFNPALPPADHFIRPWDPMLAGAGWQAPVIRRLMAWHALPEAFLYGYTFVIHMSQYRSGFLDGAYSLTGWTSFFPLAFLYKTTLPVLLALAVALGWVVRRWSRRPGFAARWPLVRSDLRRATPLLALFAVYALVSLASKLNIGQRHILPLYPVLFIFAGVLGRAFARRTPAAACVVAGLLAWQGVEAARTYPDYLAYFNPAAGGRDGGHLHLVDSSLDWGQDLPGLKAWLDAHADGAPVFLSYFGSGEPDYYHIHARRLPFVDGFKLTPPWTPLEPGLYCISATMLEHVYSPVRGPWTVALEKEYQELRALEPAFAEYVRDPQRRAELDRGAGAAQWQSAWTRDQLLRFARLCYYLRVRRPDANIGGSILIYRLSAAELADATAGPLSAWRRLIEHTVLTRAP